MIVPEASPTIIGSGGVRLEYNTCFLRRWHSMEYKVTDNNLFLYKNKRDNKNFISLSLLDFSLSLGHKRDVIASGVSPINGISIVIRSEKESRILKVVFFSQHDAKKFVQYLSRPQSRSNVLAFAADLDRVITLFQKQNFDDHDTNKLWICRSCSIYGTYKSPDPSHCGGAYFGWILGASPSEGRTCCNCVARVTGSEAGYSAWSCQNCKTRRNGLRNKLYNLAGFETGMARYPLNSDDGLDWLKNSVGSQSGPVWLRRIVFLNLQDVQFKRLLDIFPDPLQTYDNLLSIDLSGNEYLESLPMKEICELGTLQELQCHKCPLLLSPPPEVSEQGGKAVMQFLREVYYHGEFNHSMAIFLIGDGESGKTSLLSALQSITNSAGYIDKENRTVGIDITTWDLSNVDDVDFVVYDMAGQPIYKDTHTFFVGRRAIYIFVWRLQNLSTDTSYDYEDIKEMVRSWMDTLKFRIPGASVVTVATHAGCVKPSDIETQVEVVKDIISTYAVAGNIGRVPIHVSNNGYSYVVDSISGKGIQELRTGIIDFAKSLPWYGEALPEKWLNLERHIRTLQEENINFISWTEYESIGMSYLLLGEHLISATAFLHAVGKLRFFGNLEAKQSHTFAKAIELLSKEGSLSGLTPALSSGSSPKVDGICMLENTLNSASLSTVYISPGWLCDVMKGMIRHDRDNLLRYFMEKKDFVMARRVKRLICHGYLHQSLVAYMWPAAGSEEVLEYWEQVLASNGDEKQIWSRVVVTCEADINCALGAMLGLEIIGVKGNDYLVPSLLKKGIGIRSKDTLSTIEASFISCYTYDCVSLPGGFFQRLSLRVSKWAFHTDIGAQVTVCYYRGNLAQITIISSDEGSRMVLLLKSSSRDIWMKVRQEIYDVERFFPGLLRYNISEPSSYVLSTLKDPTQVLILASTRFVGIRLKKALMAVDQSITIDLECSAIRSSCSPRVLIVCIDKVFRQKRMCVNHFERRVSNGCLVLPVVFESFKILNYSKWWPDEMPALEHHSLFVDLRNYSPHKIKDILYPELINLLQQWRGFQNHLDISPSEKLQCIQCIESENVRICDFTRSTCTKLLKTWVDLELMKRQFEETRDVEKPLVTCDVGHSCDVRELLSQTVITHTIPCPSCLRSSNSRTHLFDRNMLVCVFDDSSLQKIGTISCPECLNAGRPHIFRILNVLNCDVFISYSWGPDKNTQRFIIPIVKQIEFETDLVCFFDIHGGLTVGRDFLADMLRGVSLSTVVVLFLSDLYLNSANCVREFICAAMNYKYIIPVLLPDRGEVRGISSGWTGPTSSDGWWEHADEHCFSSYDPEDSSKLIPWFVLRDFDPIDMTNNKHDDISLFMNEVQEMCCRILSRIHRPVCYSSYSAGK